MHGGDIKSNIRNVAQGVASNLGGTVTFGNDQSKGYVPLVLAVGAVLFALIAFGGLFSKK